MRRKGVPCACNPCKGKNYVRAVNNVSPDPNGDLTIRGGAGIEIIQSGDDLVINNTANPNAFVAGRNIELNPSGDDIAIDLAEEPVVDGLMVNGDTHLNGDLEVNGDIIQNGSAYEAHAEQVYTRDDYIIMRDGAVSGLPQGDYSGFQVKLYDGVNDGRLVIDNDGTARVGDVGDEQPLLTREESANLNNGALLKWDAANLKAVDEGSVGTDTKPIKIVNGVATAVANDLIYQMGSTNNPIGGCKLSNGLIINWGYIEVTVNAGSGAYSLVNLPYPFSGTNYQVVVSRGSSPAYYGSIKTVGSIGSASQVRIDYFNESAQNVTIVLRFIAVGF